MKKIVLKNLILIFILMFFFILVSCDEKPQEEEKEIEPQIINLLEGDIVLLENDLESGEFTTSDEEIVKISSDGIMVALKEGKATITLSNGKIKKEISIHVEKKEEEVYLQIRGKQTVLVDEETLITPVVIGSSDNFTFTFESNDESVVTVSGNGTYKGVSSGIATITVKAIGEEVYEKEILVYVKEEKEEGNNINNVINNVTYEIVGSIDLSMISEKTVKLVKDLKESIVGISNYQTQLIQGGGRSLIETSVGTGFIYKKEIVDGTNKYYVITNYHVVKNNEKLKVYFGYDDIYVDCEYVSGNEKLDLAVVSFTSSNEYVLLSLGDADNVSEGDFAVAIGNANGYVYFGSVTFGTISYVNRKLPGEEATFIQHDVAINPGNSGGPLLNLDGEVIGVNTLKIVDSDVDNMGFSISINVVKSYLSASGLD